jgi:hypothetical protein
VSRGKRKRKKTFAHEGIVYRILLFTPSVYSANVNISSTVCKEKMNILTNQFAQKDVTHLTKSLDVDRKRRLIYNVVSHFGQVIV